MPSNSWVGQQGSGSRAYTDAQQRGVVRLLREHVTGRASAMAQGDFYTAFLEGNDISERAFRQIVSDRDGRDYLLVNEGNGRMYLADHADEAEATTRKLHARAQTELRRVARRNAYAEQELGRRQQAMALEGVEA